MPTGYGDIAAATLAGTAGGAYVGSLFPGPGTAIGAGVGGGVALLGGAWDKMMESIKGYSQQRAQSQEVLNRMVADGYQIGSKLPPGLVAPKGSKSGAGIENSSNPKPMIHFQDDGRPALSVRPLRPAEGQANIPLPKATPGGLGQQAPINEQALSNLNNAYYNGQPAQFSDAQSRLYPNAGPTGAGSYGRETTASGATQMPAYIGQRQPGINGTINEEIPLLRPNQQEYQNQALKQLMENKADFGPIRENEIRRFHEETAPAISEQYFGSSSAYPEALGRGGSNLGQRLAAMESQYNLQREGQLQNAGLRPSFETIQHQPQPEQPGFTKQFLRGLGESGVIGKGIDALGAYAKNYGQDQTGQPQQATQQPQQQRPAFQPMSPQYAADARNNPAELSNLSSSLKNPNTARSGYENTLLNQLFNKRLGGGF